jgi:glycosyltransferase involved in cell wall biosynthesis
MNAAAGPKRVLYVTNSSKIGGGNRSLIDLLTRLDPARFQPVLALPTPGPMADWARAHDVPYTIVPGNDWSGRAGLLRRGVKLTRIAASARVGVIHAMAPTCYRAAALAGRMTGAKRVCHLGFPPEPGELKWSFWSGPDAVIGCYKGQATDVAPEVGTINPRCRVVGIPNGVDLGRFSTHRERTAATRAQLGIGRAPLVLIVGHLSEVKGHPTFLRAARLVADDGHTCHFAALGGDTLGTGYQSKLDEMAATLGIADRMTFLGFRNDVPDIMAAADIVVLPSRSEGLPLAVLEAMACAKPVIATPVGGVPEAVVDGVTGVLVPPDEPVRLAGAIRRLLADRALARGMGLAGRRRVEALFSLDTFAAGVQGLYDDLLTRSAPPVGAGFSRLIAQ